MPKFPRNRTAFLHCTHQWDLILEMIYGKPCRLVFLHVNLLGTIVTGYNLQLTSTVMNF